MAAAVVAKAGQQKVQFSTDRCPLREIPKHLRDAVSLQFLPDGSSLVERTLDWAQKINDVVRKTKLVFANIALPQAIPNLLPTLIVLEEVLPAVLYSAMRETMDQCLGEACQRLYKLLKALAEIDISASGEEKSVDQRLQELLTEMHEHKHFPSIKNFAGNVGSSLEANLKVIFEGNPRERSFFLINTWRNLLHPRFSTLSSDECKALFQQIGSTLGWRLDPDCLIRGAYFDFSTETGMRTFVRGRKMPDNPTPLALKDQGHPHCSSALSEGEYRYAVSKSDPDKPVYWGSADAKFDPTKDLENPASQAMEHVPQVCSLSGVVSDTMDLCAGLLGLTGEEFRDMKFTYLAVNLALLDQHALKEGRGAIRKNHSAHETLYGFVYREGKPLVVSPTWYMGLLQQLEEEKGKEILASLKQAMQERGYEKLPHEMVK